MERVKEKKIETDRDRNRHKEVRETEIETGIKKTFHPNTSRNQPVKRSSKKDLSDQSPIERDKSRACRQG